MHISPYADGTLAGIFCHNLVPVGFSDRVSWAIFHHHHHHHHFISHKLKEQYKSICNMAGTERQKNLH